ncbi:MAG: GNAT family N-acetyltransferase [Prolixibacteraceae bacterium]|nr:GNAT family N-acetyltransferase [Prolixibacteraceae bacterium]MBN2772748.1 GNAT family N-acetyltransferase [Prolixibacteraceae bacterium]
MEIIQVSGKKTLNQFYQLPHKIYKDDPDWVPPLRGMHEDIFNPEKNTGFKNGKAQRWIVKNGKEVVGRIAAFFEHELADSYEQPTGAIGFFESVNDKKVSALLFDTARDWLKSNGMEAMDGPVNFGENFFNWGLLAKGHKQQTFGMQYHPEYYLNLFEDYGFNIYYRQYSYRMDISNPDLPERFWKIAAWRAKKPNLSYEHFKFSKKEKYISDFIKVYEQAWRKHRNYKSIHAEDINGLLNNAKYIFDEEFVWYAYYKDEPVAFFMMLPDVNQILRKLKPGKFGPLKIYRFFRLKRKKTITRCRALVLGVIPGFQRTGVESGIFHQVKQVMLRKSWYKEMEMSWVGDFNPKMNALFKSFGANHDITHYTMRYLFDREKPFKSMPIIDE